jgi:hypothetical protein
MRWSTEKADATESQLMELLAGLQKAKVVRTVKKKGREFGK